MPKAKKEMMAALRLKRHKAGLELLSIWIKSTDKSAVLQALHKYLQVKPK